MTTDESQGLLSTTDAMVWSQEFCRIFDGFVVGHENVEYLDNHQRVDESLMLAWFASAFMFGYDVGRKATCPHSPEDQFTIADDMTSCRRCDEIFGGDDD